MLPTKPPSSVALVHRRYNLILLLRLLCSIRYPKSDTTDKQREAEEEELSKRISHLVLSHRNSSPSILLSSLLSTTPSSTIFSPSLVNKTIKLLWNDAPSALLFLDSLLLRSRQHHRFRPHPSTLCLCLDLAARLRSKPSLSRLLKLLPTPLPPIALCSLAERPLSTHRAVNLFLRSLPKQNDPLSSLNHLLRALSSSGRVETAHSLLRSLRHRIPPDAFSYHAVAHGWCLRRLPNHAADILSDMVRSGIPPTTSTYNILLHGFFLAGLPDRAVQLFRQMKRRTTPDVFSYTTLFHGLGLAGRVTDARKMFDEMRNSGISPTVASYNALIQVLCKKDSVENAIALVEEMVVDGCIPNTITYNSIIKGICFSGDLNGGVEFMRRIMGGGGWKPNVQTYNILIRCLTEAGEIEKGLEIFGEMWEVGGCIPDVDSYNSLISAMFVRKRGEDMVMAGRLVMEMVERGHVPRSFVFNRILNGLFLTGNQEFARELLRVHSFCPRLRKEVRL